MKITLNQTQAKSFTQEIFADIDGYICKEEFEEFSKEEQKNKAGGKSYAI